MPLSKLTSALGPSASDLLLWKDVKQSGAIVALVTAFWLVVSVFAYTPSQLITLAIAIVTPLSFGWAFAASLLKREGPHVPDFLTHGLNDAEISKHASSLATAINPTLGVISPLHDIFTAPSHTPQILLSTAFLGKVLSGKDLKLSGFVTLASFSAYRLFCLISLPTLAFITTLLAFTLPKAYQLKEKEVDQVASAAFSKGKELVAKVNEVVMAKVKEVQSKLPTPKKAN